MVQMLSNLEVILLSIVSEKPSYAYEINRVIDYRNMRMWVRVGVSSIYQTLRRLEESEMIISRAEKEGEMPVRRRYYITDYGKNALVKASKRLLSNLDWYYLDLNVGLEASECLDSKEIASLLTKRLAKVKSNIERMKEIYINEKNASFKRKALIKNLVYLRESEETFLREIIREISVNHLQLDSDGLVASNI